MATDEPEVEAIGNWRSEALGFALAELFSALDADGSGTLSRDEIKQINIMAAQDSELDSLARLFSEEDFWDKVDLNGDGQISFDELVQTAKLDSVDDDEIVPKIKTMTLQLKRCSSSDRHLKESAEDNPDLFGAAYQNEKTKQQLETLGWDKASATLQFIVPSNPTIETMRMADFGAQTALPRHDGAMIVLAEPLDAASSLTNTNIVMRWDKNMVLVKRSVSADFVEQAMNAQNAGATAVIIYNNDDGGPMGMGKYGNASLAAAVTIPVASMSQSDGIKLAAAIEAGRTVVTLKGVCYNFLVIS
jgi:hypothetical protein